MNECIKMDLCMGSMDQNRSMIKMDQWMKMDQCSQTIEMDQIGHIGSHWITMLKLNQVESSD